MNRPSTAPIFFVLGLGAALYVLGCGRSDQSERKSVASTLPSGAVELPIQAPRKFSPSARVAKKNHDDPEYSAEWNRFTSLDEYGLFGRTNATWDTHARAALSAYVQVRLVPAGSSQTPGIVAEIKRESAAAVEAGCDDPLIAYFYGRYFLTAQDGMTDAILAERLEKTAQAMEGTRYSPIRKMYANMRAAQSLAATLTNNTDELVNLRRAAIHHVNESLQDTMMPPREAADIARQVWGICGNARILRNEFASRVLPTLEKLWSDRAFTSLLKGQIYLDKAWQARGGDYADKVTEKGWEGFRENLEISEKGFRRAWKLDPKDPAIAEGMLAICQGKSLPREEMELWFKRAMDIDSANYTAAQAKATYLDPVWHGTPEELLEFGHQCVDSLQWKGRVPLILMEAHEQLSRRLPEDEQRAYLKNPDVWKDVQLSYERFFELNPEERGLRPNYAWAAYHCGQYAAFLDQVSRFDGTNFNFFGGREKFEEMLATARAAPRGR